MVTSMSPGASLRAYLAACSAIWSKPAPNSWPSRDRDNAVSAIPSSANAFTASSPSSRACTRCSGSARYASSLISQASGLVGLTASISSAAATMDSISAGSSSASRGFADTPPCRAPPPTALAARLTAHARDSLPQLVNALGDIHVIGSRHHLREH